jgi:hypothetical protein
VPRAVAELSESLEAAKRGKTGVTRKSQNIVSRGGGLIEGWNVLNSNNMNDEIMMVPADNSSSVN